MTDLGLKGAKAIVTGAARGIGLGIAERFAALGAEVVGWDISVATIQPSRISSLVMSQMRRSWLTRRRQVWRLSAMSTSW